MAPPASEDRARGPGANGRPGQTPRPEPRPEVIEEEEEEFAEVQSDAPAQSTAMGAPSTPIPHALRSPGARGGGVMESSAESTSTFESGPAPTRLELQRQNKQQGKLQQQIKSRLARATLNIQASFEHIQANLDSTN